MKVLLLTDNFLPSLGGVERHVFTLARYLSKESYEVHVATSHSKTRKMEKAFDFAFEKSLGIKISRPLPRRIELPFLDSIQYMTESYNVLEYLNKYGDDYDIIHYHGSHQLLLKFAKCKTPIITSVHGIFPACIWQSSIPCKQSSIASCAICDVRQNPAHAAVVPMMIPYYYIYYNYMKKSLNNLVKIICVSDYIRTYLERKIPELNNFVTVHNFIDFEGEIKPELKSASGFDVRTSLNLPSNAKLIAYFGRLSEDKGVDSLLSAFKHLQSKIHETVYLLIGGDGPQRYRLEQEAKSLKNILFLGTLPRHIQLSTIAQSDVFVHPARYPDACPTSILEAMTLGLPIVATKLGGIPELVIDSKGGYLVNPDAPIDLAEKIFNLIRNGDLNFQFGEYNRKHSSKFDINCLGPEIIGLYKAALH